MFNAISAIEGNSIGADSEAAGGPSVCPGVVGSSGTVGAAKAHGGPSITPGAGQSAYAAIVSPSVKTTAAPSLFRFVTLFSLVEWFVLCYESLKEKQILQDHSLG